MKKVKSEVVELNVPGRELPLLIARFHSNIGFEAGYEQLWQKILAQDSNDVRVLIYYSPELNQSGADQNTIYHYSQKFIPLVSKSAIVGIYGIKSREAKLKIANMITGRLIVSHKNEEEAVDWLGKPMEDHEREKVIASREKAQRKAKRSGNFLGGAASRAS
ncbi:MAG: hypothetical protein PQJ59_00920 [Spirochaetales bacterium]|nr:hypothetical protein [Spirochaetales bacterium]